jgi:GxxExxY protein
MSSVIVLKNLSYKINGMCFKVHGKLGRFYRERQYADELEKVLQDEAIAYEREVELKGVIDLPKGNRADFLIEDKIILDVKAKRFITKEDYYQMLRYLKTANLKLGLIVNFRNSYLKPKRVINNEYIKLNS